MANYPVKLLKDKDGTAFIPVVNSDSIITPEGDTLNDLLEEKQDLLTSGTNIKTINNESLLGSGNISIQGGSGASVWGSITGTLSNQTDLNIALNSKADVNSIPTKTSDLTNDSGFITSSVSKYSLTELKALTDPTYDLFLSLKADIINHNPMVITYSQNLNSSESISAEAVVLSATVETSQDFGEVYAISFRKDIISHPGIIHTLGFIFQGEQFEVVEILMIENEVVAEAPEPTSNLTLNSLEPGDMVGCVPNMEIRYSESDEWTTLEGVNTRDIFIKNVPPRGTGDPVGYIAAKTRDHWYMVYAAVYHKSGDELGYYISELTYYGNNPINPIAYILKNSVRKDRLIEGANVSIEDDESGCLTISANENESYGTCSSSGDASVKVVNIVRGSSLVESAVGNILRVRFDNALTCNNPTLRVKYGTSFDIYDRDTNNKLQSGAWGAGDIVTFYWDGSAVRAIAGLRATTANYGEAKLSSSVSSASTTEAATSSAVKAAYDLAASKGTVTSVKINATSPIVIDNNTAITTSGERTISHATSGVTAGTYKSVTVDSKGHVTAGTNPTTLSGYGITDAKISNGTITLGSNTITPSTVQNIKDGSTTGSVRTSEASSEGSSYTMGRDAFAEGCYTQASGRAAHAEGNYTTASGSYGAHAEGNNTKAIGNSSHAEGTYTEASEDYSHAEGHKTYATGLRSHAEGYYTVAAGASSHAEGGYDGYFQQGTVVAIDTENKTYEVSGLPIIYSASNDPAYNGAFYSKNSTTPSSYKIISTTKSSDNFIFTVSEMHSNIAVGDPFYIYIGSKTIGRLSHAEGDRCYTIGIASHAEGCHTIASGSQSHAGGYYTIASKSSQTAIGKYNDNKSNTLFEVGNGTADDARSNAFVVYSSGKAEIGADPTTNMGVATKQYVDTLTEKNMITAVSGDATITTTSDSKYTNMVFNSTLASVGSKLSLNTTTGVITIGSGINYVKVSCGCYISMGSSGTYHRLLILKNGTQYGKSSQTKGQYSPSTYGSLGLSNILIPVAQGDTISVQTFSRLAGTYTVGEPYISVEAL